MKTFRTLAPVGVNPGALVALSKEQAAARAFGIRKADKKGTYEVTQRIEFKAGETFELDGELPKNLADLVEEKGKRAAPAPAPTPAPDPDPDAPSAGQK
jgi:hypothetical protein